MIRRPIHPVLTQLFALPFSLALCWLWTSAMLSVPRQLGRVVIETAELPAAEPPREAPPQASPLPEDPSSEAPPTEAPPTEAPPRSDERPDLENSAKRASFHQRERADERADAPSDDIDTHPADGPRDIEPRDARLAESDAALGDGKDGSRQVRDGTASETTSSPLVPVGDPALAAIPAWSGPAGSLSGESAGSTTPHSASPGGTSPGSASPNLMVAFTGQVTFLHPPAWSGYHLVATRVRPVEGRLEVVAWTRGAMVGPMPLERFERQMGQTSTRRGVLLQNDLLVPIHDQLIRYGGGWRPCLLLDDAVWRHWQAEMDAALRQRRLAWQQVSSLTVLVETPVAYNGRSPRIRITDVQPRLPQATPETQETQASRQPMDNNRPPVSRTTQPEQGKEAS